MTSASVPDRMLAAQVVEYSKSYVLRQVPVPRDLGPHDLLIKVAVASLCHTDFMVRDGVFNTKLPVTGSHEGSGTVVGVGSAVENFQIGDRVMAGIAYHPCGTCVDCQSEKNAQYCEQLGGHLGVTTDGFFAEYARIDATTAAKLPDQVSFKTAAPMACAGSTVWRAVLQTGLKRGEWLALVGSGGGLGHLGIQFAKALGLKVVGIDARDEGLELTKEAGADVVVDVRKGQAQVVEEVQKITDGKGVDATVNLSDAQSAAATACAVTKMHGLVVQVAQPEEVSIPFREFVFRDIRVKGSLICSPSEARQMLKVVAEERISVKVNPFHGLEHISELVELAHSGKMKGKGMVVVDEEQIKRETQAGMEMV